MIEHPVNHTVDLRTEGSVDPFIGDEAISVPSTEWGQPRHSFNARLLPVTLNQL